MTPIHTTPEQQKQQPHPKAKGKLICVGTGMRMAGQMGNEKVTILNLKVVQADAEQNLLLVKGAVPGPNGGIVLIRDAVKGGKSTAKGGQ